MWGLPVARMHFCLCDVLPDLVWEGSLLRQPPGLMDSWIWDRRNQEDSEGLNLSYSSHVWSEPPWCSAVPWLIGHAPVYTTPVGSSIVHLPLCCGARGASCPHVQGRGEIPVLGTWLWPEALLCARRIHPGRGLQGLTPNLILTLTLAQPLPTWAPI